MSPSALNCALVQNMCKKSVTTIYPKRDSMPFIIYAHRVVNMVTYSSQSPNLINLCTIKKGCRLRKLCDK